MKGEQEKRLRRKEFIKTFLGFLFFLIASIVAVSISVLVYERITVEHGKNNLLIAGLMFLVCVVIAIFYTAFDYIRRRLTVDEPVKEILFVTDRIASGDFSARVPISHSFEQYDDLDLIKENLNKMAEELSKTELFRTDFISSVSHEIKTPLSVIRNYAKALCKETLDDETRKRYAKALVDASEKLTTLVGNILKLNKLENLEILPEKTELNLSENLLECVLSFEELIEKKKIELVCDVQEDVNVLAPPDMLEIVWNNLLSNAVKFTDEGGRVEVSLKSDGNYAVVTVTDTGCGIAPKEGGRIFEKFYQADGSRSKEGNGLGLALVKKVIDLSGGEISVKSVLNKGTTFTVKLKIGR